MLKGFYNLTSGMLSQSRRLNVVGTNMTNVSTPGYKTEKYTDIPFEQVLYSRVGNKTAGPGQEIGEESYILAPDQLYVDHTEGIPEETGLPLDFAIQGEGFFAVETEDGVLYTRNGSFSVDDEGYLILGHYGRILNSSGQPIYLATDDIRAGSGGELYINDGAAYAGPIGVFAFQDNGQLAVHPNGLFDANGQAPAVVENPALLWKCVERSNVEMIDAMTEMMTSQRALQGAAQVIKMYDGLLTKATNDLGRV